MAVYSQVTSRELGRYSTLSAEYYTPECLTAFKRISSTKYETISLCYLCNTEFPITYGVLKPREIERSSYKLARIQNSESLFLDSKDLPSIKPDQFEEYKRSEIRIGDIVLAIGGYIGPMAIVSNMLKGDRININRHLARISPDNRKIDSYFLMMYLSSVLSQILLKREIRGAVQAGINIADLKLHPIILLDEKDQVAIGKLARKSESLYLKSKELYSQAENLLEQELGLDKITFENPISYEASFSNVLNSRRGDAEFFNPELRNYYSYLIESHEMSPITNYVNVLKFGNPTYAEKGIPIITQKHLQKVSPKGYGDDLVTDMTWITKYPSAILKENDLLFYSVGAYLGKTNIWFHPDDKAVTASFITLIRAINYYDAGYLMILLNSKYGILQSKVFQSGTSQQYIYPKDIKQFLIPDISVDIRKKVYKFLQESHEANEKSQLLLIQAKRRVEELIEQGVN